MKHRAHRRVGLLPTTSRGSWAAFLAAAAVLLSFAWSFLPGGAGLAFACGLAGGGFAIAAIRHGDRTASVFAALLPFGFVVLFILAELLIGHD